MSSVGFEAERAALLWRFYSGRLLSIAECIVACVSVTAEWAVISGVNKLTY